MNSSCLIHTEPFQDHRGINFKLYDGSSFEPKEIFYSNSKNTVFRGLHCSPYGKMVHCVSGSIKDIVIDLREDSETNGQHKIYEIKANDGNILYVPPYHAHGYLTTDENTVIMYLLEGKYDSKLDKNINWRDPRFHISDYFEDLDETIMSTKDDDANCSAPVDFLLFGSTGYFGGQMLKILKDRMYSFACADKSCRLQHLEAIEEQLEIFKPKFVICTAGVSGTPNIDWCKENACETIQANVVGQLNMAEACRKRNIRVALCGSGYIYRNEDDKSHFTEEDEPNNYGHIYCDLRIQLEKMLVNFDNVINLRIQCPISIDDHPKNLLQKLMSFDEVHNLPMSVTVIDAMFPFIPFMLEDGLSGNYNFVNPGTVTLPEIIDLYCEIKNVEKDYNIAENPSRIPCTLSTSKLERQYKIKDALEFLKCKLHSSSLVQT
jgi:3,5-epimerase/4-reductase